MLISGALTLLTNAVIADCVPSDDILEHIAPNALAHINFRGIYRFPIEQYLGRLLPSHQHKAATA